MFEWEKYFSVNVFEETLDGSGQEVTLVKGENFPIIPCEESKLHSKIDDMN